MTKVKLLILTEVMLLIFTLNLISANCTDYTNFSISSSGNMINFNKWVQSIKYIGKNPTTYLSLELTYNSDDIMIRSDYDYIILNLEKNKHYYLSFYIIEELNNNHLLETYLNGEHLCRYSGGKCDMQLPQSLSYSKLEILNINNSQLFNIQICDEIPYIIPENNETNLIEENETICEVNWFVGNWSECINETQQREVSDLNNCSNKTDMPNITQTCEMEKNETDCIPNWKCSNWSICTNSKKIRECNDTNNCNITENIPEIENNCTQTIPTQSSSSSSSSSSSGGSSSGGHGYYVSKLATVANTTKENTSVELNDSNKSNAEVFDNSYIGDKETIPFYIRWWNKIKSLFSSFFSINLTLTNKLNFIGES